MHRPHTCGCLSSQAPNVLPLFRYLLKRNVPGCISCEKLTNGLNICKNALRHSLLQPLLLSNHACVITLGWLPGYEALFQALAEEHLDKLLDLTKMFGKLLMSLEFMLFKDMD